MNGPCLADRVIDRSKRDGAAGITSDQRGITRGWTVMAAQVFVAMNIVTARFVEASLW
jgi:hypothetical protein